MSHKIEKSQEISCFELLDVLFWELKASCSLGILYGCLGISKLQIFFLKKIAKFCFSCNFFLISGHIKTNPGSVSVFSLKCWIRIRNLWIRIWKLQHLYFLSFLTVGFLRAFSVSKSPLWGLWSELLEGFSKIVSKNCKNHQCIEIAFLLLQAFKKNSSRDTIPLRKTVMSSGGWLNLLAWCWSMVVLDMKTGKPQIMLF
jgi:hypothetical protein